MSFGDIVDILWFVFLLAGAAVMITWMVVMNKAIDQVSHDLRRMEPGAVWLSLIPVFGFVWNFLVVNAVSEGLFKEFQVRNMMPRENKPGYSYGLTGSILLCCCIIPYAGVAIAIIGLVVMVLHIVNISEYNRVLQQSGRWETRYHQRMEAMRHLQGQQTYGYGNQTVQNWPQQTYQAPVPAPPLPPPTQQPPPSYYDVKINSGNQKEKPKNPFE